MKVSSTQHLLIRLAMINPDESKGMFYPHERMYDPGKKEWVQIYGAKFANGIKALINSGLAIAVTELHPYAFQLTTKTMEEFKAGKIEEKV